MMFCSRHKCLAGTKFDHRNQRFLISLITKCSAYFFHPDYTVGIGITPILPCGSWAITTGRESHPALKLLLNYCYCKQVITSCQQLNIQKLSILSKSAFCLMCKNSLCKYLTKLNTFLIEAVDVPYKSLEHNLVLKVSKKCTE